MTKPQLIKELKYIANMCMEAGDDVNGMWVADQLRKLISDYSIRGAKVDNDETGS